MDWIHIEVGLPDHPKVGRLSRRLQVDRSQALAIVVRLLCWTGIQKENGHLNGTEPEDLADVCHWAGDPNRLVEALVGSGWLDQEADGLCVHGWMDRQGRVLRAREREAERRQRNASVPHAAPACATLPHAAGRGEERSGEENLKTLRAEPLRDSPPSPTVLTFPCRGNPPTWDLTEATLAELRELFPSLDVLAQARLALAWAKANPGKRKTAKGSHAFLTRWLTDKVDRPDPRPIPAAVPTPKTYREWEPPR